MINTISTFVTLLLIALLGLEIHLQKKAATTLSDKNEVLNGKVVSLEQQLKTTQENLEMFKELVIPRLRP